MSEAAAALASDRAARFFSGGTLLMRAINEGDTTIATLVRSTDPGYRQIRNEGARIDIGAGVRMVDILASRDLAFLHPVARVVGGPAVRAMATVGGNLFAPSPYGDLTVALLALDATVTVQGAYGGAQQTPLEQFLAGRDRRQRRPCDGGVRAAPGEPRRVPLPQGGARQAQGRVGAQHRRASAGVRRTRRRRARRLRRHGADADPRPRGRARAGGPQPRRRRHRAGAWPPPRKAPARRPTRSPAPGTAARSSPIHLRRLLLGETG